MSTLTISRPVEDSTRRTWLVLDRDGDPVTRLAIGDLLRLVADKTAWTIADVDPEHQAIGVRPLANNHHSPASIKYYRVEDVLGRAWRHFPRGRICK